MAPTYVLIQTGEDDDADASPPVLTKAAPTSTPAKLALDVSKEDTRAPQSHHLVSSDSDDSDMSVLSEREEDKILLNTGNARLAPK